MIRLYLNLLLVEATLNQTQILEPLSSLGPIVELDFKINASRFEAEMTQLEARWRPYNLRKKISRFGLSLTSLNGEIEGNPDLDSLTEYNFENHTNFVEKDFSKLTDSAFKLLTLQPLFKFFENNLGRSHLIRLNAGGHFPPHRDAYINPTCFRIFAACSNCEDDQFVFLINKTRVQIRPWQVYFIDTRLEHSVFSFCDNSVQLVLNIFLNEKTVLDVLKKVKIK